MFDLLLTAERHWSTYMGQSDYYNIALRKLEPDIPWLPILQGDNFEERLEDLELRRAINLLPTEYASIGSLVGRGIRAAIETVRFYADQLPGVKFHGFGIPIKALDDPVVFATTKSWGRGKRNMPVEYRNRESETQSAYTRRLASLYWTRAVRPRLTRSRQMTLHEFFNVHEISPLLSAGGWRFHKPTTNFMEAAMTTSKTILTLESVLKQVAVERKAQTREEKEQAANELAKRLAEKGIFAMYGGRKGHGFWLYRVGVEMAKQMLEAFDPEKFWDLADSIEETPIIKNDGKKSGNSCFWMFDDALKLAEAPVLEG